VSRAYNRAATATTTNRVSAPSSSRALLPAYSGHPPQPGHARTIPRTFRRKNPFPRPGTPLNLEDARRLAAGYVEHYNTVPLHSAIGYVPPADKLTGREPVVFAEGDRKLDEARARREVARQATRVAVA